jgi:predicted transposase YbfD/YdcC
MLTHPVHAWSVENEICLGQRKVSDKSNEITALPELLDMIEVGGAVVTIDATGTQTAIAEKLVERGGDYILAVKGNQGELRQQVLGTCSRHCPVSDVTDVDKGHGRRETRRCEVFECGLIVNPEGRRVGLKTIVRLTSTRFIGEKETTDVRYYISSLDADRPIGQYIREHWRVENSLHWTLDVVFREDGQRKREGQADENFAIVRKSALNLLKRETDKKNLARI